MKKLAFFLALLMAFTMGGTVSAMAEETGIDTSVLDMDYYSRYRDKGYSISV